MEKRPRMSHAVPDPALRRYLNPLNISPTELYSHTHAARSPDRVTASIQLQSYSRPTAITPTVTNSSVDGQVSKGATAPPVFAASVRQETEQRIRDEAARAESGALRQREPRENCDFLRVVVLEMSMRRNGKLRDEQIGRARLWLPPRVEMRREVVGGVLRGVTPMRWKSLDSDESVEVSIEVG